MNSYLWVQTNRLSLLPHRASTAHQAEGATEAQRGRQRAQGHRARRRWNWGTWSGGRNAGTGSGVHRAQQCAGARARGLWGGA